VLVLNSGYAGSPSKAISFMTAEGGVLFDTLHSQHNLIAFLVPEAVLHAAVLRRSSSCLHVQWDPPPVVNGVLIGYTITHRGSGTQSLLLLRITAVLSAIYSNGEAGFPDEITVNDPKLNDIKLEPLMPGQTYSVSVQARTAQGPGPAYIIEDTTLPSGRKYSHPNFQSIL
jgi:hypothetical protein